MMSITTLRNLTDEEIVANLDDSRTYSPIIEELCLRLVEQIKEHEVLPGANTKVECPVCMAALKADYDTGNNMFTLTIDKDQ